MTKIFRNQKIWFCAFLKKLLGIQSPSCRALYGLKYEFDYLIECRDGTIKELERQFAEEIKKHVGGLQHDENI